MKTIVSCVLVTLALHMVAARVVDSISDIKDLGDFIQFKQFNFSIDGASPNAQTHCNDSACLSEDDDLPQDILNGINKLLTNPDPATIQSLQRLQNVPRMTTHKEDMEKQPSEVAHSRKKRCLWNCGGKTVVDPHAQKRLLLEQERLKMDTLSFCYDQCAKAWTQWSGCTKPCGSGTQTRTRETVIPGSCAQKFEELELGCPHHTEERRPCNEGCRNGGRSSPTGCTGCSTGWGGNCCDIKLKCPFPGIPAHGETTVTASPVPVGGIAMYNCDAGYSLDGQRYSTCENTEQWSTSAPTCQRVVCSAPAMTDHLAVRNEQDSYDFGESIHFYCDPGYVLEGPAFQTCQDSNDGEGRWNHYTPHCVAGECPAPTQDDFPNGIVQGSDFSFPASITFICHDGYELLGQDSLSCTRHGRWSAFFPRCEDISCPPPFPPINGDMQLYGTDTVVFSCSEGYRLANNEDRVAVCQNDGVWSKPTPLCEAIECDAAFVSQIPNGFTNGGVYRYPHSVEFGCFPGHILEGLDEIRCQENAQWSGDLPNCRPCPLNTYMLDGSIGGVCTDCPENSHTSTVGNTNRQQCLCDDGYSGPIGGPCQLVTCPLPDIPINGDRGDCDVNVGDACEFTCNPGYIPSAGGSRITCLPSGVWSNVQPTCAPCPVDSYNPPDEPNVCLPCGQYMSTEGRTAQVETGCICGGGWEGPPGGPCTDLNECGLLPPGLACGDECRNTPGSYHCECTVPGYELDTDGRSCLAAEQCRNLTLEDAPLNGGLVCRSFPQTNSKFCGARCNPGHVFVDGVNSYETCGPTTNFHWTHELNLILDGGDPNEARIADCLPEFIPGFRIAADVFFFTSNCEDLTDSEKDQVKQGFVNVLTENGVCGSNAQVSCTVENVQIICGRREKRDANGVVSRSLDFHFDVLSANVTELTPTECDNILCPAMGIPQRFCQRYCKRAWRQYARSIVQNALNVLEQLSQGELDRVRFTLNQQTFEPQQIVHGAAPNATCFLSGQQLIIDTLTCVPCSAGTYLKNATTCERCPAGTYQLFTGQTSCQPCPLGSSSQTGQRYCHACDDGWYGENCVHRCSCVNGDCDEKTGECHCRQGWEGPRCSVDIDRCESVECPPGTTCQDKVAPIDGFECI